MSDAHNKLWELRPHLSHSSLRMFRRCPEQFRRNYLLGEKGKPGVALLIGRAVHSALAHDFRARLDGGPGVPYEDIYEAGKAQWLDDIEENEGVDGVDWGKDGELCVSTSDRTLLSQRLFETSMRLASLYHHSLSPRLAPVAVEEEFNLELEGCPVPINGYIDLRTDSGLREFKTTSRLKKNPMPGDWMVQGRIYQLLYPYPMAWDVLLKKATPKVVPEAHVLPYSEKLAHATRTQILNSVRLIEFFWETFGLDTPWPDAVDNEWACGYCPFAPWRGGDCYYHGGK